MPEPPIHGMHGPDPDRRDAERLSAAWNALVLGETGAATPLPPGDAEVIRKLDALAPMPRPSRAFVRHLREELMDASVAAPALSPEPIRPRPSVLPPSSGGRAPIDRRRWLVSTRRSLSTAATIALVAATLLASVLAVVWQQSGGDGEQEALPAFAAQTASPLGPCLDCEPSGMDGLAMTSNGTFMSPNGANIRYLGHGAVPALGSTDADLAATNAQLQHWILDPGERIEMDDVTSGVHGVVVDIVLQGVATITVDTPAIVHRGRFTRKANIDYPQAGETVELVAGDSISYAAGRAKTVTNPLMTMPMQLKSAVLYNGDVTLTRPADVADDGRQIRVDGDNTFSQSLPDDPFRGLQLDLAYVALPPGTEFDPDALGLSGTVIGPVDSLNGDWEGYVLRLTPQLG